MSTSKHPPPGRAVPPRDDLETDPGIGASRGTTISGEDPHILRDDGVNTEEGDVGNDTDATGAPTPIERQRDH
jgi:hypothetical protein